MAGSGADTPTGCRISALRSQNPEGTWVKSIHLTNQFHQTSGGISTFYRSLFTAAGEIGHQMVLIASGEHNRTDKINDFVQVHYLAAPAAPFFDRRYRVLWPKSYLNPFGATGRRLRHLLATERPDLVEIGEKYTLCWLAGLIRKGAISSVGRPALIGTSHERMDDNIRAFVTLNPAGRVASQAYLGRCYIPLFDHHIANSRYTAEELETAMVNHHRRPIEVIPMGADIERLRVATPSREWREEQIRRLGGGVSTRLLLYIGRLSPEKNIPLLVDLMAQLRRAANTDYRLLIAGSGPLEEWLRQETQLQARGLIHLLGQVGAGDDKSDLVRLYVNCDAFVHPNPREPFGIAPLEAMAAGLPLIGPDRGGVLTYASRENAWLCAPNAESYSRAIISIFDDPVERIERTRQARLAAERFHWSKVARLHLQRYREIGESSVQESVGLKRIEPVPLSESREEMP